MKYTTSPFKYIFLIINFLVSFYSHAIDSIALESRANSSIEELYHTLGTIPSTSIAERIDWISSKYLGTIYELGALGEGAKARYDQFPKYRLDAFDCDTYVNTILSLALATSLPSFQQCIKLMRYKNGTVSYINRNHFTDLDWNINNQQRGLLKDITLDIKDKQKHPVALNAVALIDKPNWYAFKTLSTIRVKTENKTQEELLLAELKNKGTNLKALKVKIPYLPLTTLFPNISTAGSFIPI